MTEGQVLIIYKFDNLFKDRHGRFTSFDSDGKTSTTILPGPPDYEIICDGCGNLIKEEKVNALSFEENFIHSIQCDSCVKEYFRDLPKKEKLDPMALLNKATYKVEKMNVNTNARAEFEELQKEVIKSINQFIEEIKIAV